jgi:hypothetical protein
MFVIDRPTLQKETFSSDTIEYYSFFIDASAGMSRLWDIYIDHYNHVIDMLIDESKHTQIYGSLESFDTYSKVVTKLVNLQTDGNALKIQKNTNFLISNNLLQQRFLYFAIRTQIAHLSIIQQSIPEAERANIRIHGFLFTSGCDEQRESNQTWISKKLLQNFLLKNIGYTIIVNDYFRNMIQEDLGCSDNIFYTGK